MDSEEHDKLVSIIRGVHEKLKRAYLKGSGDYEKVWKEHLLEVGLRNEYASAMLKLATEVWNKNHTRINWCHFICLDYFHNSGLQRILRKENKSGVQKKMAAVNELNTGLICDNSMKKIMLLDVGSCYNPFSKFEEFNCVAVDLTPATEDVLQCDFLQIQVVSTSDKGEKLGAFSSPLKELPKCFFHVVVFSLVLEYLPAPEQRWLFCVKAWRLLEENGLLLIITPDSKSQHHNAPMIKNWKKALFNIGFRRISYEKQIHMHCMAFRKIPNSYLPSDIEKQIDIAKLMYIPQDFNNYKDALQQSKRTFEEDEDIRFCFHELPMGDIELFNV